MSKSSSKLSLSFSCATALTEKIGLAAAALILAFATSSAAPLNCPNSSLFEFAAEMGQMKGSPSGMFWDYVSTGSNPGDFLSYPLPEKRRHEWVVCPLFKTGYYAFESPYEQDYYWNLKLHSEFRYGSLSVHHTVNADKRYEFDSFFPGNKDRFLRGRVDEAYFQLDYNRGFIRLGRLLRNWGPFFDKSMVLSTNPYSYDALEWQFFTSFMEFRHLFAAFSTKRSNLDSRWENTKGVSQNRFLGAHSLNFMLGKWITLGFTETIVFARERNIPDMQYINPFTIYAVNNGNQEGDVNLMTAVQWSILPLTEKIEWKGQIAIDDFQIDDPEKTGRASDDEPTHWGMTTSLIYKDPFSFDFGHYLKADYTYASKYLYTVSDENTLEGERYSYLGKSLGFPEIDGDRFSFSFRCVGENYWTADIEGSFSRKGEKTIFSKWGTSERPAEVRYEMTELPLDYLDTQFPSGTVETSFGLKTGGSAYLWGKGELRASLNNSWIKNRNNIPTNHYEYVPSIHLELSLFYDDLRIPLPE